VQVVLHAGVILLMHNGFAAGISVTESPIFVTESQRDGITRVNICTLLSGHKSAAVPYTSFVIKMRIKLYWLSK